MSYNGLKAKTNKLFNFLKALTNLPGVSASSGINVLFLILVLSLAANASNSALRFVPVSCYVK